MRWALCGLLAVCGLLALPLRAAEPHFGFVRGTLRYDDGLPTPGVTVTITDSAGTMRVLTGADGTFGCLVRAGQVRVALPDAPPVAVTVAAGDAAAVALTARRAGVMLTLTRGGRLAEQLTVAGVYAAPDVPRQEVAGAQLAPGRYWFPAVPARATAFAVRACTARESWSSPGALQRQWAFTDRPSLRELAAELPAVFTVPLVIRGEDEAPLASARVSANLAYAQATPALWNAGQGERTPLSHFTQTLATDGAGLLQLPNLAPGRYTLTIAANRLLGFPVQLDVSPDGASPLTQYRIVARRSVRQVVCDAAGRPAARAEVFAIYSAFGLLTLQRAVSDANGVVTWRDLPPARVIVWGLAVPAGVLPRDAADITGPLPPPQPESAHAFQLVPRAGEETLVLYTDQQRVRPAIRSTARGREVLTMEGISGAPMSLLVLGRTPAAGMRALWLPVCYLPYVDDGAPQLLFQPQGRMVEAPVITLRLSNAAGQAAPLPARALVTPDACPAAARAVLLDRRLDGWGFLRPTEVEGRIQVRLPGPGAYRLLGLGKRPEDPALPDIPFSCTRQQQEVAVTLP